MASSGVGSRGLRGVEYEPMAGADGIGRDPALAKTAPTAKTALLTYTKFHHVSPLTDCPPPQNRRPQYLYICIYEIYIYMGNFVMCEFRSIGEFFENAQICVLRPVADRYKGLRTPARGAGRILVRQRGGRGAGARLHTSPTYTYVYIFHTSEVWGAVT